MDFARRKQVTNAADEIAGGDWHMHGNHCLLRHPAQMSRKSDDSMPLDDHMARQDFLEKLESATQPVMVRRRDEWKLDDGCDQDLQAVTDIEMMYDALGTESTHSKASSIPCQQKQIDGHARNAENVRYRSRNGSDARSYSINNARCAEVRIGSPDDATSSTSSPRMIYDVPTPARNGTNRGGDSPGSGDWETRATMAPLAGDVSLAVIKKMIQQSVDTTLRTARSRATSPHLSVHNTCPRLSESSGCPSYVDGARMGQRSSGRHAYDRNGSVRSYEEEKRQQGGAVSLQSHHWLHLDDRDIGRVRSHRSHGCYYESSGWHRPESRDTESAQSHRSYRCYDGSGDWHRPESRDAESAQGHCSYRCYDGSGDWHRPESRDAESAQGHCSHHWYGGSGDWRRPAGSDAGSARGNCSQRWYDGLEDWRRPGGSDAGSALGHRSQRWYDGSEDWRRADDLDAESAQIHRSNRCYNKMGSVDPESSDTEPHVHLHDDNSRWCPRDALGRARPHLAASGYEVESRHSGHSDIPQNRSNGTRYRSPVRRCALYNRRPIRSDTPELMDAQRVLCSEVDATSTRQRYGTSLEPDSPRSTLTSVDNYSQFCQDTIPDRREINIEQIPYRRSLVCVPCRGFESGQVPRLQLNRRRAPCRPRGMNLPVTNNEEPIVLEETPRIQKECILAQDAKPQGLAVKVIATEISTRPRRKLSSDDQILGIAPRSAPLDSKDTHQSVFGFRRRARRMGAKLSRLFVHKEAMCESEMDLS